MLCIKSGGKKSAISLFNVANLGNRFRGVGKHNKNFQRPTTLVDANQRIPQQRLENKDIRGNTPLGGNNPLYTDSG